MRKIMPRESAYLVVLQGREQMLITYTIVDRHELIHERRATSTCVHRVHMYVHLLNTIFTQAMSPCSLLCKGLSVRRGPSV